MPKVPLITRSLIERLKPPTGQTWYYIMEGGGRGSLTGFGVRVHRHTVSYIVRYRRRPYVIGRVNVITLERARELARVKVNELVQERDKPAASGRRKTVAQLADLLLEQVVAPRNSPRTLEEYRRLWRLHILPRFGALRLHEVTPELVLRMKHEMAGTPVAANRALQQLAAAFSEAIKLRWLAAGENPADERTVQRYTEDPESRALTADEYRRIGAAIREAEVRVILPARTIAALRLLLLTGARPHEILAAELAWVELGPHPRIQLPRAKGDRPGRKAKGRAIYLGQLGVDAIRSVPRESGCKWLIPADDQARHLGSIDKAWARVCKMAGVEGTSPKSARHSYRSAGPEAGIQPDHMRELMGHATSEMTDQVYWHVNQEAQERAAQTMDEHLGRLLLPVEEGVN